MVIGWVLWPIILIVTCTLQSLPRLVRHWRVPLLAGVIAFPVSLVTLKALSHWGPIKFDTTPNLTQFTTLVRWWQHWRMFGPAALLSDTWTRYHSPPPNPNPTNHVIFLAFLHVSLAASVTVVGLAILLVFLYAIGETLMAKTDPFSGGHP